MPDYEIKEWNEDNFDVNMIPYTAEAYSVKKYAFVSDYARYWVLYHYGGVYFDTDVEVIKSLDDIIAKGPFMGIEYKGKDSYPMVAPGLGIAVEPGHSFYQSMLNYYAGVHFLDANGNRSKHEAIVRRTTNQFIELGMKKANELQQVDGIWIYPQDYFNPFDDATGRLSITENTRTIHWYSRSWQNVSPFRIWLSRMSHRIWGRSLYEFRTKWLGLLK